MYDPLRHFWGGCLEITEKNIVAKLLALMKSFINHNIQWS